MLDYEKFRVEKIDDKIRIIRKSDNSAAVIDISKKDKIPAWLVSKGLLSEQDAPKFAAELDALINPPEELKFEPEEKEIPVVKTEVPIPTEASATIKKEEKPKELDAGMLVARYQELTRAKLSHETALSVLEAEFGIPKVQIEKILPEITPLSEQIAPPSPPPKFAPTPEEVTATVPPDIVEELKTLSDRQRKILSRLAEIYQTDEKTLVLRLMREAEESPIPTHWLNKLLQHAIQNKLFAPAGEKGYHATFATTDSVFECLVDKSVELEIDKCYKIGERGVIARCIALSIGLKGRHLFPDLPFYKDVKPVADVGTIHKSFEIMKVNMKKMSKVFERLKEEKTVVDVVSGVILDVRGPFTENNIWYLTINDGSDLPSPYTFSIELPEDNPFGITGEQLRHSIGKTAFVYGFMKLIPASEAFSRETVKIIPEYMLIG